MVIDNEDDCCYSDGRPKRLFFVSLPFICIITIYVLYKFSKYVQYVAEIPEIVEINYKSNENNKFLKNSEFRFKLSGENYVVKFVEVIEDDKIEKDEQ